MKITSDEWRWLITENFLYNICETFLLVLQDSWSSNIYHLIVRSNILPTYFYLIITYYLLRLKPLHQENDEQHHLCLVFKDCRAQAKTFQKNLIQCATWCSVFLALTNIVVLWKYDCAVENYLECMLSFPRLQYRQVKTFQKNLIQCATWCSAFLWWWARQVYCMIRLHYSTIGYTSCFFSLYFQ